MHEERTDLKEHLPYFKQEIAKGRLQKDIAEELGLPKSDLRTISYYLRKEEPLHYETEADYTIRREKAKKIEPIVVNGKTWYDVTPFLIYCGG